MDCRIGIYGPEYPFSSTFLPSRSILRCGAISRDKSEVKISAFQQAEFFSTAEIFTSLFSREMAPQRKTVRLGKKVDEKGYSRA